MVELRYQRAYREGEREEQDTGSGGRADHFGSDLHESGSSGLRDEGRL